MENAEGEQEGNIGLENESREASQDGWRDVQID